MGNELMFQILLLVLVAATVGLGIGVWLDQQHDPRYMSWGQKMVRQFIAHIRANAYSMFHFGTQVRIESDYIKHGFHHEEVVTFIGVVNRSQIVKTYWGESRDAGIKL